MSFDGPFNITLDSNDVTFNILGDEKLRLTSLGNVGIGTNVPSRQLTISKSSNTVEQLELRTTGGISDGQYTGIKFTQESDGGTTLGYIRCNFQSNGSSAMSFATRGGTTEEKMRISDDGKVGIGTTNPDWKLLVNGSSRIGGTFRAGGSVYDYTQLETVFIADTNSSGTAVNSKYQKITLRNTSYSIAGSHHGQLNGSQDWYIGTKKVAADTHEGQHNLYFSISAVLADNSRTTTDRAYISAHISRDELTFTGQHRSFVENIHISQYQDFEGLIVCANKNEYIDINKEVTRGKEAIQINQSLPYVSLCKKEKDKSCFGVLSGSEDPDSRQYEQGSFVSVADKTKGDSRFYVNSVGEGAIWVSNKNGNLESGDYITTSSVRGYGQKQDSEFLANYTVAKITMDCDFQPELQFKKKVMKRNVEVSEVNASGNIYDVATNILVYTQPSGDEVTDDSQKREEYVNPDYDFTITNDYYITDVTENILNEHGEIQWEDSTEQEYAYDIRYVDATGNIITKQQHDTMIANSQEAYIAAFVGCTYHCG